MLCAMIESMGLFLFRSIESHAKMVVIMNVLKQKSIKIKDPRQQVIFSKNNYNFLDYFGQRIFFSTSSGRRMGFCSKIESIA